MPRRSPLTSSECQPAAARAVMVADDAAPAADRTAGVAGVAGMSAPAPASREAAAWARPRADLARMAGCNVSAVGSSGGRRRQDESVSTRPTHQLFAQPTDDTSRRCTSSSHAETHLARFIVPCMMSTLLRPRATAIRCSTFGISASMAILAPVAASCVSTIMTSQSSSGGAARTVRSLSPK